MKAKSKSDTLKDERPKFTVIYNCAIGKLSPFAMAVYVVICFHSNNATKESYPGHERIAREARCSRSQVKRAIAELVKEKLISIRKVGRVGMQHNEYTVLAPAPTQAKKGGAVPTGPGCQSSKDGPARAGTRSCQSPELDLVELDLESKAKHGITERDGDISNLSPKKKKTAHPKRAVKSESPKKSKATANPAPLLACCVVCRRLAAVTRTSQPGTVRRLFSRMVCRCIQAGSRRSAFTRRSLSWRRSGL